MYNRLRVLIIEETSDSLKKFEDLFNGEYEVVGIKEIKDALQMCEAYRPNLIIQNLVLGSENSGLNFLKNFKSSEKYKHIPVLIISSSSSQETLTESLKLGASDYIIKPLNMSSIQLKVNNMLVLIAKYRDKKMLAKFYGVPLEEKSKNAVMNLLENMIEEIIENDFSPIEVAEKLNIGQGTLTRWIKEQFNLTPNQYLLKRKLQKAQVMLLSDKEIKYKDVCIKYNFRAVADFTHSYEKYIGKLPTRLKGEEKTTKKQKH